MEHHLLVAVGEAVRGQPGERGELHMSLLEAVHEYERRLRGGVGHLLVGVPHDVVCFHGAPVFAVHNDLSSSDVRPPPDVEFLVNLPPDVEPRCEFRNASQVLPLVGRDESGVPRSLEERHGGRERRRPRLHRELIQRAVPRRLGEEPVGVVGAPGQMRREGLEEARGVEHGRRVGDPGVVLRCVLVFFLQVVRRRFLAPLACVHPAPYARLRQGVRRHERGHFPARFDEPPFVPHLLHLRHLRIAAIAPPLASVRLPARLRLSRRAVAHSPRAKPHRRSPAVNPAQQTHAEPTSLHQSAHRRTTNALPKRQPKRHPCPRRRQRRSAQATQRMPARHG